MPNQKSVLSTVHGYFNAFDTRYDSEIYLRMNTILVERFTRRHRVISENDCINGTCSCIIAYNSNVQYIKRGYITVWIPPISLYLSTGDSMANYNDSLFNNEIILPRIFTSDKKTIGTIGDGGKVYLS